MVKEEKISVIALKTEGGYLNDVWEEWGDEINYDFTDDPLKALKFYGYGDSPPKYLGANKNIQINNTKEACDFLDGKLVKVEITIKTEWNEFLVW